MPRWLAKVLTRVRKQAGAGDVRFTAKAAREILEQGLSPSDACEVLAHLATDDSAGRLLSRSTGEWMYVFKTHIGEQDVYVKIVLRQTCLVVSLHESEDAENG